MFALNASAAVENTPKLVYLVIDGDTLIAANVHFSRFDKLQLSAQEVIVDKAVSSEVIVVATNQRYLGYSALVPGWRAVRERAQEHLVDMRVEDYSGLVVTSDRVLNFNGANGVWAQVKR